MRVFVVLYKPFRFHNSANRNLIKALTPCHVHVFRRKLNRLRRRVDDLPVFFPEILRAYDSNGPNHVESARIRSAKAELRRDINTVRLVLMCRVRVFNSSYLQQASALCVARRYWIPSSISSQIREGRRWVYYPMCGEALGCFKTTPMYFIIELCKRLQYRQTRRSTRQQRDTRKKKENNEAAPYEVGGS